MSIPSITLKMSARQTSVATAARYVYIAKSLAAQHQAELSAIENDRNKFYRAAELRSFLRSAQQTEKNSRARLRALLRAGSKFFGEKA